MDRYVTRPIYDADHEALRDSAARFFAGEPSDLYAGAREYGFLGLAEVEDVRFAAVVLEAAMNAGRPDVALALAMHDSFALPMLGGRTAALTTVVDSGVRAEPRGDGWTLHGRAESVVNGLGAELIVVADDSSDLVFAVPAAGVHRSPADAVLGLEDLDVADLVFDGVVAGDRLDVDLAAARARHRAALAVAAVAGARSALRTTVDYVQQRKAFGTPIASFGNTRHVLGALGARIAAVEAFVDSVLLAPDVSSAAAAKLTATEVLGEAVDTGVQLHGGYGYMWEYPIARAYAAARFFRLHGGAGEHLDGVLADAVGL